MPADLYCEIDGKQQGPITGGQLKQLAVSGKLKPHHLVWQEGKQTKAKPARAIKGLFDATPRKEEDLVELEPIEEVEEAEEVVLEPIEEAPARKKSAERSRAREEEEEEEPEEEEEEEPEPELIAEVSVTYREGFPDFEGPLLATLNIESTGLRFLFEDDEETEYPLSFKKITKVMDPAKGDFPEAMKSAAFRAKVGGKVGKLASGLLGNLIGDTAGDIVGKVGGKASDMASQAGELGRRPNNRITVVARLQGERCKVRFDINGDNREEMNEQTERIFKKLQKARDKFARTEEEEAVVEAEVEEEEEEEEEVEDIEVVEEESKPEPVKVKSKAPVASAGATPPGKSFRVLSGGQVKGPYSLKELRGLVTSGVIGPNDLIGVEAWLPLATLAGMLGGSAGPKPAAVEPKAADDKAAKKPGAAPAPAAPPKPGSEEGTLAVDDEFKLL